MRGDKTRENNNKKSPSLEFVIAATYLIIFFPVIVKRIKIINHITSYTCESSHIHHEIQITNSSRTKWKKKKRRWWGREILIFVILLGEKFCVSHLLALWILYHFSPSSPFSLFRFYFFFWKGNENTHNKYNCGGRISNCLKVLLALMRHRR